MIQTHRQAKKPWHLIVAMLAALALLAAACGDSDDSSTDASDDASGDTSDDQFQRG